MSFCYGSVSVILLIIYISFNLLTYWLTDWLTLLISNWYIGSYGLLAYQEFVTSVDCVFFVFFPVTSSKLIVIFSLLFSLFSVSRSLPGLIPYEYKMTPSSACILLSSYALNVILLIFSMNKLFASLLNLYWDVNIVSVFFRQSL